MIANLQRRHRLSEQERDCSQVSVAAGPEAIVELVHLFGRKLGVLHVAKMGFVMCLPLVDAGEEIFGELQGKGDEVVEGVEDFVV